MCHAFLSGISRNRRSAFMACVALLVWAGGIAPLSAQAAIYRWVSSNGTVSYGDQPPPNAKKLQALPPIPPAPPAVAHPQPVQPAAAPPPADKNKTLTAIERLNLLTALNNYQSSLPTPPEPRQHVYIPAYIGPGPFPAYRPGRPSRWHRPPPRPIRPPSTRPPTVLLPPPAPASAYASPVLLP
ncbi:MAG: DUF4124 domain-containing protein [Acidithiobacillus sp.]|nr:DUF4124 domain-containing protein [Acidithiobacillus sp.]